MDFLSTLAERIAGDREITRVEQVVAIAGLPLRKLQRLFDEWVGVPPKWVIQRYRLHEAAERIALGEALDWADLALELGYADQAHFIRDFKKLVGRAGRLREVALPAPGPHDVSPTTAPSMSGGMDVGASRPAPPAAGAAPAPRRPPHRRG